MTFMLWTTLHNFVQDKSSQRVMLAIAALAVVAFIIAGCAFDRLKLGVENGRLGKPSFPTTMTNGG